MIKSLRSLFWSLFPHKHKYGRPFNGPLGRIKVCKRCELPKAIAPWLRGDNRDIAILDAAPKGYRDLMWCPYLNEPAILEYEDGAPHCPNCNGNFEAETHVFMGHIHKPHWAKAA